MGITAAMKALKIPIDQSLASKAQQHNSLVE
jgi:hypothetical protein